MKRKSRSVAEIDKLPQHAKLTKQEAAAWTRMSIWTINRLIDQKLLRATQYLGQWRTTKAWIDEYDRMYANSLSVAPTKRAM